MKASDISLFQPIQVGKITGLIIAINGGQALIKMPDGKTKWIGLNKIRGKK